MATCNPADDLWEEYSNDFGFKEEERPVSLLEKLERGEDVSMIQLINDLIQQLIWIHQHKLVHFQVTLDHVFVLDGEEATCRYFLAPPGNRRIEFFAWEKPYYSPEYKMSLVRNQLYQPTQGDDVYAFGDLLYHILSIKYALPRKRLGSAWAKSLNYVPELQENQRRGIQTMLALCWKASRPVNALALRDNRIWNDAIEEWTQG